MTRIIFNVLFLVAPLLFTNMSFAKNMEWQRLELEQLITNNYREVLNNLVERQKYIIKSEVKYNNPGMPNFDDMNETDLKISDIAFDESKGDYIAFSKVGLEIPVIDKLYKEHQSKLKEMYRYNESFDLFKNIESINVTVTVDKSVPQETFNLVEGVLKKHNFSVAGFKANVKVTHEALSVPSTAKEKAPNDSIGLKDIINFISQFGNAFGLITAVILIGVILNKLLKLWMDFMEKLKAMENEAKQEQSNEEESNQVPEVDHAEGEDNLAPSFERFLNMLKLSEEQTALILKKWIAEADQDAKLALTGVVQQLENDDMQKLFKHLSSTERESWNKLILEYLSGPDLIQANKLIEQRVVKEIVGGSFIDDFELIDLILSMNNDTIKEYVLKGNENSSILMNLLNPEIIAKILDDLSVEEVEQTVSNSLSFDIEKLKELDGFKKDLKEFVNDHKTAPFTQKLVDVLQDINADKEELIYQYVSKSVPRGELIKAALANLPGQIVLELPPAFIKASMQNYSTEAKVELLLSLEEDKSQKLMETFLDEGSSAKEMIQMEMDNIKTDEIAMKRIEKSKNNIWSKFLVFIRECAANDQEYKSEIEDIVYNWVDELKAKVAGE
jgi:hypothetical protein